MKRRNFLASLVGVLASGKALEQLAQEKDRFKIDPDMWIVHFDDVSNSKLAEIYPGRAVFFPETHYHVQRIDGKFTANKRLV